VRPLLPGRLPAESLNLLCFLGLAVIGFAVPQLETVDRHIVIPFTKGLAALCAAAIQLLGGAATAQGQVLSLGAGCGSITVASDCSAIEVSALLAATILAYPAPWRLRLLGCLGGVVLVQALNMVRIVSLLYLNCGSLRWYNFFHLYLWHVLLILGVVLFFLGWIRWQTQMRAVDR